MGVQRALQDTYPELGDYIVEPAGSISNGGPVHSRRTEGTGVESIPPFLKDLDYTGIETVGDEDVFYYVRRVVRNLGLSIGSPSGAVFTVGLEAAKELPHGANLITVFSDSSKRCLSEHIYEE